MKRILYNEENVRKMVKTMNDLYGNGKGRYREPTTKVGVFLQIWTSNALKMIPMSIMYCLLRILLIPGGLAVAGITDAAGDLVRRQHYYGVREGLATIKKCWKKALIIGILDVFVTLILLLAGWFYLSADGYFGAIGLGCFAIMMVTYSFMKYYIWPQVVLCDLPLTTIYKNAFIFAFINLGKNLLIGIISLACYVAAILLLIYVPYIFTLAIVLVVAICFFPSFKHLLVQYCVFPCIKERMVDPYYLENPNADQEERKRLGL